jgi:hypothetical protein
MIKNHILRAAPAKLSTVRSFYLIPRLCAFNLSNKIKDSTNLLSHQPFCELV